ncbi:hypothetical protein NDU88_010266 [Pleurodeles waltl]|uniref:Uncharacterized protein n=1 Tax=Pleurodeles waltl TaxID=8319 RepID=A0AAV7PXF4_PLEWA|nr:hypothetical protein NDU88_010266 [Pleurodeles waltl]
MHSATADTACALGLTCSVPGSVGEVVTPVPQVRPVSSALPLRSGRALALGSTFPRTGAGQFVHLRLPGYRQRRVLGSV